MLPELVALVLMVSLVVGPLLWRVRQDRRQARAEMLRADANAALFRAFGGESLVAVHVRPPSAWRPGRVVLSAPADWQELLPSAWARVAPLVPAGWELVVTPASARVSAKVAQLPLRRAA
jgi:hypothetical protein